MKYYYSGPDNQPIGPIDITELHKLYAQGKILLHTWVIEQGNKTWKHYSTLIPSQPLPSIPPPIATPTSFDHSTPRHTPSLALLIIASSAANLLVGLTWFALGLASSYTLVIVILPTIYCVTVGSLNIIQATRQLSSSDTFTAAPQLTILDILSIFFLNIISFTLGILRLVLYENTEKTATT